MDLNSECTCIHFNAKRDQTVDYFSIFLLKYGSIFSFTSEMVNVEKYPVKTAFWKDDLSVLDWIDFLIRNFWFLSHTTQPVQDSSSALNKFCTYSIFTLKYYIRFIIYQQCHTHYQTNFLVTSLWCSVSSTPVSLPYLSSSRSTLYKYAPHALLIIVASDRGNPGDKKKYSLFSPPIPISVCFMQCYSSWAGKVKCFDEALQ